MKVKVNEGGQTLQSGAQLDVSKPHWPEYFNVHVCIYVCVYVCMYVCMYMLVYVSHFFKAYKIIQIKYQIVQMFEFPTDRLDHDAKAGDVSWRSLLTLGLWLVNKFHVDWWGLAYIYKGFTYNVSLYIDEIAVARVWHRLQGFHYKASFTRVSLTLMR